MNLITLKTGPFYYGKPEPGLKFKIGPAGGYYEIIEATPDDDGWELLVTDGCLRLPDEP